MDDFWFSPVMFHTKLWSAVIVRRFSQQIEEGREHVYHYTTGEGLKGIIEGKSLWATGAYYFHDTSEIDYGCQLAASVLEKGFAAAGSGFAELALRQAHTVLSDSAQRNVRIATLYVACFCESDNLLSQWRTYSRSGGFALGFRVAELGDLQPEHMTVSRPTKVLYQEEDQIKRVRDLIGDAIVVFGEDDVVRGDADNPSADSVLAAGGEIAQILLSAITSFKAPDFAEEREWRLVCQPQYVEDGQKIDAVRKTARFRASSRGLAPFVELRYPSSDPNRRTLPIDSVRFGPTQTPDLVKSVTRMLLDANGFHAVRIDGSRIPVVLDR
jgi:hypothetical protein